MRQATASLLKIDHFNPLLKITPPSLQATQVLEAGNLLPLSPNLARVRYLKVSMSAQGASKLEAILQQSLARMAAFLALI